MATSPDSPAGQALFSFGQVGVPGATTGGGLGDALRSQVEGETEEERRKHLLGVSQLQTNPFASQARPALFAGASAAGKSLFGGMR
jgi:hypothetical protein